MAAVLVLMPYIGAAMDAGDKFWSDLHQDLRGARTKSDFVHAANRAQTNLVGLFIGVLIAAIVAIQVFIPVVNDAIASSNVSGTTETILSLLGLFSALLLLISLASPLMRRI